MLQKKNGAEVNVLNVKKKKKISPFIVGRKKNVWDQCVPLIDMFFI